MLSVKGSRGRLYGVGLRPPNPRSTTLKTFFFGGGVVVGEVEWRRLLKTIIIEEFERCPD